MLSKLGLVDQKREDEKYEELTKNIPRKKQKQKQSGSESTH